MNSLSRSLLRRTLPYLMTASFFLCKGVQAQVRPSVFPILKIEENLIVFSSRYKLEAGRPVMIFRKGKDGLTDILARGKVEAQQGRKVFVQLELNTVRKAPQPKDQVALLAQPLGFGDLNKKKRGGLIDEEEPLPPEPGYIQLTYGTLSGSLAADNSNRVNFYKTADSYSLTNLNFTWFFEFVWRMGISYESWEGSFPTATYFRTQGDSTLEGSQMSLMFRFRKSYKYFRPTFRLVSYQELFSTFNPDEALVSSQMKGLGVGMKLAGQFTSVTWTPKVNYFHVGLHEVYLDTQYTPLDVTDIGDIRRGTSSEGSSALDVRLGLNALIYVPWIPWFKRWTLEAYYGKRVYDIAFTGPTASENPSLFAIPQGGTYKENYDYVMIRFGLRMDDVLGLFLMPR